MSVSIGLIGAGVMGSEHGRILSMDTPRSTLTAVCDYDEARARNIVGKGHVFKDPLELINSHDVDAVVIASPDSTHFELVLACIEAGKPVLCEKPLAMTSTEALTIVEAEVKKGNNLVQVGYMRRFDPGYLDLKANFDEGMIGTPEILHNVHRNPVAPKWMTGEMLVTNAFVHEIDAARWLLGSELESVRVASSDRGDPMMIVARMANGSIVSTELFMNCKFGYQVQAELVGSEGTLALPSFTSTLLSKMGAQSSFVPSNWIPRFRAAYKAQSRAWVDTVITGRKNHGASAWDGYVTTAVAERIVASVGADETIKLSVAEQPKFYS
jgi:myo-inositol 2-dehydrogenase/D-chiro-inositol 1-dehydrogenase